MKLETSFALMKGFNSKESLKGKQSRQKIIVYLNLSPQMKISNEKKFYNIEHRPKRFMLGGALF